MLNYSVIDEELVRFGLSKAGIEYDGDKLAVCKRLAGHYKALNESGRDMALCDVCGCTGPADAPACPFCGDSGEVVDDLAKENQPRNELEAMVNVFLTSMRSASQSLYNSGQALIKIIDEGLWKQELGEDGQPLYDGPYSCIESKCGMLQKAASRLVKVAREYDAKAFSEHGVTRLQVSMRLPSEDRGRFLERATVENTSKRGPQDRALARAMIVDAESTDEKKDSVLLQKEPKKLAPVIKATERVRIRLGTTTVPMYRRGKVRDKIHEQATSIREFPWCDLHLGGDVFLGIRISKDVDGNIVAIVDTKTVKKTSGNGALSIGAGGKNG